MADTRDPTRAEVTARLVHVTESIVLPFMRLLLSDAVDDFDFLLRLAALENAFASARRSACSTRPSEQRYTILRTVALLDVPEIRLTPRPQQHDNDNPFE